MIELLNNELAFRFPEVHPEGRLQDQLPAHPAHSR
jgi:hypothetical protein